LGRGPEEPLRPAASLEEAEAEADDDILDLPEPVQASTPAPVAEVVELPLPEPEVRARELAAPMAEDPEPVKKPTLFERMMNRSRKPKDEPQPIETLAPEPEADRDDGLTIPPPPFFRAQRN
jgi:hypothetical protein